MHRTKRTPGRRLSSLSARIERREQRARERGAGSTRVIVGGPVDDGCPICVAMRDGGDVSKLFVQPDGGPPAYPQEYLIAEARKVLTVETPQLGAPVEFLHCGGVLADGSFAMCCFLVDREGRILWKSPTQTREMARLPSMPS